MNRILAFFSLVAVSLTTCSSVHAQVDFDIVINYSGPSQFQSLFDSAEAIWESILPQRVDGRFGNNTFNTLTIDASIGPIDGAFNVVGQAGPTSVANDGSFIIATLGEMEFDEADIDFLSGSGSFEDVILHEMGHVLGIGSLWTNNNLYVDGSGEYTGTNGLAQYQQEFDPNATFVPVELDGGPGTADSHWDEGNILVSDPNSSNFGRPLSEALLTGTLSGDTFISNTTGGTLEDLGYVVNYDAIQALSVQTTAVPEPSSLAILAGASLLGVIRRRR